MVSIIALANACTNKFETGSAGDMIPKDPVIIRLLKRVGIEWQTIKEIKETVLVEIDKARVFLQLTKQEESTDEN